MRDKKSAGNEKRPPRRAAGGKLLFIGAVALAVAGLAWIITRLLGPGGEDARRYDAESVQGRLMALDWVEQELLTPNEYSRPGTRLETVNAIVVHYVGNPGTTAAQNRNYFEGLARSGETYASSNFIIGAGGEILQCVPVDEVAYCSNFRNSDTLSVECCHPDETGRFTEETYDALVRLVSHLLYEYGLSSDNVIRHYDVSGKLCPLYYVENAQAWDGLREDVARALEELKRDAA